jgi:hypothetical protein
LRIEDDDENEEEGDTATFSLVAELMNDNDDAANNSIIVLTEGGGNDEPRHPHVGDADMLDFHENKFGTLNGDQRGGDFAEPCHFVAAGTGFSIYCDDDDDDCCKKSTGGGTPATTNVENDEDDLESVGDTATFSVLGEVLCCRRLCDVQG